MGDEGATTNGARRRSRGPRGKLRRHAEMDHVMIEETFSLNGSRELQSSASTDRRVGDGCYVSATVHNRRFYGVLIDQAALKAASHLYMRDEASGLDLNRRMEALLDNQRSLDVHGVESGNVLNAKKRAADYTCVDATERKRLMTAFPDEASATLATIPSPPCRQIQKFRYVDLPVLSDKGEKGSYRELLATYANIDAAADGDRRKAEQIRGACIAGGKFVGDYFYQYEVLPSVLDVSDYSKAEDVHARRASIGMHSFLQLTNLPQWFPLAHHQVAQQQVAAVKSHSSNRTFATPLNRQVPFIPMEEQRSCFRVCVVGGGIAGLSCCLELFRECAKENVDVEVVLLEGRKRLGGRLWTDRDSFKDTDGVTPFGVDLGASWIHGIDLNPLSDLAREAGVDFIRTDEEVKMLQAGLVQVDPNRDTNAGKLFDKLLDFAADDTWESNESQQTELNRQRAIRWYASGLVDSTTAEGHKMTMPSPIETLRHRRSSDVSVDVAVARVILSRKLSEFAKLSDEERRMLHWNLKNVEYALGANFSDLSMKFWNIDERHAFEGDHVILRQGYSQVVDHMHAKLSQYGDRFRCLLDFPVGKVEYARKSEGQQYPSHTKQLLDISDSCCLQSQDSSQRIFCDFVVAAVPLGVLKNSVDNKTKGNKLEFIPSLPASKLDAINAVGFGLLDKVYLQFPLPFWRDLVLHGNHTLFGNASGVHPHHYMFFDVGKSLKGSFDAPAILMSLISGMEAVKCEMLSDEELVSETMEALRTLFSDFPIPEPIAFRITRWGSDRFARGSYTFLPPGTTDEDFQILQSAVNGNGDSLLLEGSETMRLFFAGEHTSALHPSMAHGALLSGVRAAKEVVTAMCMAVDIDDEIDRLIPLSIFRMMNPYSDLRCSLCNHSGSTWREGSLLAFKRGSRQVLVHNNCAVNCPEVEIFDGHWKHVIKAITRARMIECSICGQTGASIGCSYESCLRSFHFSCAEDTGWRFEEDGKEHFCDIHRFMRRDDCNRISMEYFLAKEGYVVAAKDSLLCAFCGVQGDSRRAGKLLAFQQLTRRAVVHEHCARYTNIVDVAEDSESRFEQEYRNIFAAIDSASVCSHCTRHGATINCAEPSCTLCYHFVCCQDLGWKFEKLGLNFTCLQHRKQPTKVEAEHNGVGFDEFTGNLSQGQEKRKPNKDSSVVEAHLSDTVTDKGFIHSLFCLGATEKQQMQDDRPGNIDIGLPLTKMTENTMNSSDTTSDDDTDLETKGGLCDDDEGGPTASGMLCKLSSEFERGGTLFDTVLVRLNRPSLQHWWNVEIVLTPIQGQPTSLLSFKTTNDPFNHLDESDIVTAINGTKVGSNELDNVKKIFARLKQEVDVMVEVQRPMD